MILKEKRQFDIPRIESCIDAKCYTVTKQTFDFRFDVNIKSNSFFLLQQECLSIYV